MQDSCLKASSQAGYGDCLNIEGFITRVGLLMMWELSADVNSGERPEALYIFSCTKKSSAATYTAIIMYSLDCLFSRSSPHSLKPYYF